MIRAGYEIADIQKAITDFLRSRVAGSAPWTSWEVVEGWPSKTVFANFSKLFLYSHSPLLMEMQYQAGGTARKIYEIVLGAWSCSATGGAEEAAIAGSALIALFGDSAVNATAFNSTIGGVSNTGKNFLGLGMAVEGVTNARRIEFREEDSFRMEVSLVISC